MKVFIIGGSGYCGKYLSQLLPHLKVSVRTLDLRPGCRWQGDYRDIRGCPGVYEDLITSDFVLWFAGASSVAEAEKDPVAALSSNCLGLISLRERMNPKSLLVYASTASLYSVGGSEILKPPLSSEDDLLPPPSVYAYDQSKFAFDFIQQGFLPKCLGLRMGTVCGWGADKESTRFDTCFNAMNLAALDGGMISLTNGQAWRTLLFLPDLFRAISRILENPPPFRILNVGSINIQMARLAARVLANHGPETIISCPDPGSQRGYSFRMDLSRFWNFMGSSPNPRLFGSECRRFARRFARERQTQKILVNPALN